VTAIDLAMSVGVTQAAEGVSRLVSNWFVSGLWQGVVLAAGVGICLRLVPRTTAAVRFTIWTVVFAALAVLPLVHAYSLNSGNGIAGHAGMVHVDLRWSFAIGALWLILSLVRGVKLAMSAVRLRGIWKRAVPVEGCDEVLSAAGFRGVELCTSSDVDRPSVIGFFSPRILIPEELFARLTTAEFGQIVLHEVGHLRRADDWINLLQKLSLVVFPLNPVLIWIERRLCLERELACDDDVLRLTKAPKAYATCLTNLAEQRLGRRATALSLGVWEKRSELARRVHSILRGGEGMGRTQARVLMGVLVVALLSGSAELARCPEFVSFSSQNESPAAEVVQSLRPTAGYQAASFRMPVAKNNQTVAAHETLLKASMPVDRGTDPRIPIAPKHRGVSERSKQNHVRTRQTRGLTVLTSWEEEAPSRRVFAEEGVIFTSYAAVRVAGGWLVIQL
jgi:beta-lactamase regulating signal transducer with metallopeptidase domain